MKQLLQSTEEAVGKTIKSFEDPDYENVVIHFTDDTALLIGFDCGEDGHGPAVIKDYDGIGHNCRVGYGLYSTPEESAAGAANQKSEIAARQHKLARQSLRQIFKDYPDLIQELIDGRSRTHEGSGASAGVVDQASGETPGQLS
jgi:hypothetical protein